MLADCSHYKHVVTDNDNMTCLAACKVDRKRHRIKTISTTSVQTTHNRRYRDHTARMRL